MIKFQKLGPVISPDHENQAKFNAGMIKANGEIHVLYRLCEKISRWHGKPIDWYNLGGEFPYVSDYICYAKLNLDGTLQVDSKEKVIYPEFSYESVACEDPRIVEFEGEYYIFYCALGDFDSIQTAKGRVAIAKTSDFKTYEKLGVIDNYTWDKDAFIFPERINGKIVYMHRVAPHIQIDYFDSIEELLSAESWVGYEDKVEESTVLKQAFEFETRKIGGGVPPIKTDKGWLLIYHGVDQTFQYHTAVALLDIDNPSKVVAKLPYSVLSPEEDFETSGDYLGCVFAQGYYIHNGELYISYGTADKYTAIAKTNLNLLLKELDQYRV